MSSPLSSSHPSAEDIAAREPREPGFLILPEALTCFAEREMRLRQLAAGHPMGDFLRFVADIAHLQQEALNRFPAVPLPDAEALRQAALFGQPPLPAAHWPRDLAWQACVRDMAHALSHKAPEAALSALKTLEQASGEWLEIQADRLLNGISTGLDVAAAPLIGAALQVYWTHLVRAVQAVELPPGQPTAFGRIDDASVCPCCGSRPTDSIVKAGGDHAGQRYLHCSLCGTEWHMVRITCTHCHTTKGLVYQSLSRVLPGQSEDDAEDDAREAATHAVIQAETCESCGHYLKLLHADRDPMVEPVADDLASVTLDLLIGETGVERQGVNFMLMFGDAEPDAESAAAAAAQAAEDGPEAPVTNGTDGTAP